MKIVLFIIFAFLSLCCCAQQIPNSDFENWVTANGMLKPDKWDASNEDYVIVKFNQVTPETEIPYSGLYSVKLETTTKNVITVGKITMPGIITLGTIIINKTTHKGSVKGGIVFPYRPYKLKGYYKYLPASDDSCLIAAGLQKHNDTTGKMDTIGLGKFKSSIMTTWTKFEVLIKYTTTDIPDSLNIVILSSANLKDLKNGSVLWVDSLYFDYDSLVSLINKDKDAFASVYPNPVKLNTMVEIELPKDINKAEIVFYNMEGREIKRYGIERCSGKTNISLAGIKKGMYFYNIQAGTIIITRKKLIVID